MTRTFMAKEKDITRKWFVIDAQGKILGRLAVEATKILRGKHHPLFTPHVDTGDHVIIINADKIVLTGNKLNKKIKKHHTGYPGGFKETSYAKLMQTKPEFVVKKAIIGMLPHNRLGSSMAKKLRVYSGPTHPHQAQKPGQWPI
ncbi:MAG TPA: 50S ribosomal protein L13 [Desulfotomaculum sp.]|nr:MAG: 50S ribosomal protein L13 [Desulfotomaculum sp. 46_80]KUK85322.1 MAG: 50S ribosomal protein L13 [Desulfofundulus kuznetsovii]HAG10578.1 50S ribosomal protein L13 [Desulfotomaculum sp.]HBY03469.1 50S ribosomal protein L13 [Desulfotomaculum sp.]